MGSINLGNLFVNMYTGTNNNNIVNSTKGSSDKGSFNEALGKATQNETNKNVSQKSSNDVQSKENIKKPAKAEQVKEKTEDEKEVSNEVAAAILDVLSTELKLPVEEIMGHLEELGLSPIDLLNENNFSQFITSCYGEISTADLLMEQVDIKDISKLFSKIQEVSTQVIGDEIHTIIQETTVTDEMLTKQVETVVGAQVQEIAETAGLEETINSIWQTNDEETLSTKELVTQTVPFETEVSAHHLGLTVPIEAFESTVSLTNDQILANQNNSGVHVKPEFNIASQIVDHIEVTKLEQMQEIKMQLSPKELGQLTIKLVEKNGVLVAEIKVESEKTKEFILSEINTLKESLSEQGIEVSNVQVDVRQDNHTSQMQQQRQKSSRRIQEIIAKHLQELEEEEAMISQADTLDIGESEIDYMI